MTQPSAHVRHVGPERVLLGVYLVFVVAAGSRSIVQLATHAERAPLAYALSFAAAVVYAIGFVLARRLDADPARRGRADGLRVCAVVELVGVLAIGTWSVLDRGAFPDATVWSYYGAGYLAIPLVLPVVVLWWLRRR